VKCRHCGVPIIPGGSEGAGWYHDLGEDDPTSPYVNCFPTTVAEPLADRVDLKRSNDWPFLPETLCANDVWCGDSHD